MNEEYTQRLSPMEEDYRSLKGLVYAKDHVFFKDDCIGIMLVRL